MDMSVQPIGITRILSVTHPGLPDYVVDLDHLGVDNRGAVTLSANLKFFSARVLATLPYDDQGAIFTRFVRCMRIFEEFSDLEQLRVKLQQAIAHMYAVVDFNRIRSVAFFDPGILIPDQVPDTFKAGESVGTSQQTYTKSEYRELLIASFALRLMIPIWLKFMSQYRSSIGRGFAERQAFLLINRASVLSLPAMAKLVAYIRHYIAAQTDESTLIRCQVAGAGTFAIEELTTAKVIVTVVPHIDAENFRIHASELSDAANGGTPLTKIYYCVKQATEGGPRTTTAEVRAKAAPTGGENSDGSRAEEHRAGTTCTPGEVTLMDHYANSAAFSRHFFQGLEGRMNVGELIAIQEQLRSHMEEPDEAGRHMVIYPVQISLAGWFCGSVNWRQDAVLPLKALDYIGMGAIYNVVACVQSYLLKTGNHQLAALLNAEPMIQSGMAVESPREHIREQELLDKLKSVFPASTYIRAKKRRNPKTNGGEEESRIVMAINQLVVPSNTMMGFASNNWLCRLPRAVVGDQVLRSITGHELVKTFGCPKDIRIQIANILIDIYK